MKRFFYTLTLAVSLCFSSALTANAAEASYLGAELSAVGIDNTYNLTDADYNSYTTTWNEASVTVSRSDGIHSLYIVFDRIPQTWVLTDPASGQSMTCGTNAFLHEFVDVPALFGTAPQTLTLTFPANTVIADIYAFSDGELPNWVQQWQPPCEEADLLLFSSHSDDEQLFFAGVLPLYAGEKGYNVQVAYIVQHFQVWNELNHQRPHEQLNGLWAVGVTNYPVMSDFPDLYSESLEGAISAFKSAGVTEEDFASYMTECIRRFKPLVVVTHDINGEYGHGTHIYCTNTLRNVLTYADDPTAYPSSAEQYGTWLPEKVYLHLYAENPIVLDLDTPLAAFDGKTAFEMTQHGFSFHKSQHWTWFYRWIYGTTDAPITKAAQINGYSPCLYGLYHTTVGADTVGGDFFENIVPYAVRNLPVETLPPETEPLPETTLPETIPPETNPTETAPAETNTPETSLSPHNPTVGSDKNDILTIGLFGILVIPVLSVIVVYAILIHQLNSRRGNRSRGNRRRK